jgi:sialic acid synthase SpsE
MLCTSQYPTPPQDVNIRKLTTLQQAFPGLAVGFSDHTRGPLAAALAVARGARIFEKHFTMDNDLPGPDHWFSEEPAGLAKWIEAIRTADQMLGSPFVRPTAAEWEMRSVARRSVVALCDIKSGEVLTNANTGLRRPGNGLPPAMIGSVLGLTAARDIKRGECLSLGDMRT